MSGIISLDEDPEEARNRAAAALKDGLVVVLPTDSVYALVADAFSRTATQQLFGAKGRGRSVPLSVLIRSPRQTTGLVQDISEAAERLMASYWPGPLTLVFRATEGLTWDIGITRGTVGLRIPTDDFLLGLIAEVGPLAATSANKRGHPVPETATEARRQLGLSAPLYIEAGPRFGPRSTIVDVTREGAEVLSVGAIPAEHITAVAGGEIGWGARPSEVNATPGTTEPADASDAPDATGSPLPAEGTKTPTVDE